MISFNIGFNAVIDLSTAQSKYSTNSREFFSVYNFLLSVLKGNRFQLHSFPKIRELKIRYDFSIVRWKAKEKGGRLRKVERLSQKVIDLHQNNIKALKKWCLSS